MSNLYKLHNQMLQQVTHAKYLGVTIQSDTKWDQHVTNIYTKGKQNPWVSALEPEDWHSTNQRACVQVPSQTTAGECEHSMGPLHRVILPNW